MGIILSKSGAEKLANHNVDEITITLNNNDLLLNLQGDDDGNYKCFPDIGEALDGRILAARRRINHNSILYDLSSSNLSKINFGNDTVFYVDDNTIITDIDVYYNGDIDKLKKYPYYTQIVKYLEMNKRYNKEIVESLSPYMVDSKFTCSDDVKFLFRRSKDFLDTDIKWRFGGNTFDNMVVKIKTKSKNPLYVGSKLTGRYGNKGVCSAIIDDELMPVNEYGERAEMILNPLGEFYAQVKNL